MKILTIDQMLEAAHDTELPDYDQQLAALEKQATKLAKSLAKHMGVSVSEGGATYERDGCGICATFVPKTPGQPCPQAIGDRDTGGDWE